MTGHYFVCFLNKKLVSSEYIEVKTLLKCLLLEFVWKARMQTWLSFFSYYMNASLSDVCTE